MPVSIKKKLGAAICMLLIAAIMMISSTYAWFTLSTAPEVKGIQTNVGANGNLEIALLDVDTFFNEDAENGFGIKSDIGDSMYATDKDVTESNVTWGNIVDLSAAAYGLSGLTLLPGALNITENTVEDVTTRTIVGESPLYAPKYGSDGRVISVDKETKIGRKDGNLVMPYSEDVERNGVGIVGVASTMTLRLSLYQAARAAAQNAITAAYNAANGELNDNATTLSAILVKVARGNNSTKFNKADMDVLGGVISAIQAANNDVWTAIKQIAIMSTLSEENSTELEGLSDDDLQALANEIAAADDYGELSAISHIRLDPLGNNTTGAIKNYLDTEQDLNDAEEQYELLAYDANNQCTYGEARSLLDLIIENSNVTVNGIQALGTNKEQIENSISFTDTNVILLNSGSGVFYDIAVSVGNLSASTTIAASDITSVSSTQTAPIRIATNAVSDTSANPPVILPLLPNARNNAGAGYTGGGSSGNIADVYGYVIDFAFRTNAPTGSKLLLKSGATQRIYTDSDNENTLGGGTFVKFTSDKLTIDEIRALVSALRIVFAIPELGEDSETGNVTLSYKILTIAVPDITVTVNATTGEKTYDGGTASDEDGDGTEEALIVNIALFDFDVVDASDGGKIVTLGTKKLDAEDNTKNDLTLLTLTQNVAQKLSTVIYFDGDYVDNSMVANATQSISGALNLQFATDAELVPMENAALRGDANAQPDEDPEVAAVKAKLLEAIETIEDDQIYIDAAAAVAAETATQQQQNLVTGVAGARTAYNNANVTAAQLKQVGNGLRSVYAAAGGQETLPTFE